MCTVIVVGTAALGSRQMNAKRKQGELVVVVLTLTSAPLEMRNSTTSV